MYKGMPTQAIELPGSPVTTMIDMDGGANQVYIGLCNPNRASQAVTVTTFTAANPGLITSAAHGLNTDNGVYISGATGDWAALNGAWYRVVWASANTFSLKSLAGVAKDTSTYTGTFNGTMVTNAPRTCDPIWYVTKNFYSGTDLVRVAYGRLENTPGFGHQIWDNRAVLIYD